MYLNSATANSFVGLILEHGKAVHLGLLLGISAGGCVLNVNKEVNIQ